MKYKNKNQGYPSFHKALIPEGFVQAIREYLKDEKELNIALRIMAKLWIKFLYHKDSEFLDYFPFSKKYKLSLINNNKDYYAVFKKLENIKIYKSTGYDVINHRCKYVKLNKEWINTKLVEVNYYQYYKIEQINDITAIAILKNISQVNLPFDSLSQINDIVHQNTTMETRIEKDIVKKGEKIYYKKKRIKLPVETFIKIKMDNKIKYHKTMLYSLLSPNGLNCSRNETNHRMDHALTKIPMYYLKQCKLQGEKIVELDMSNCQPCLFAHFLEKLYEVDKNGGERFPGLIEIRNKILKHESNHSLWSEVQDIICQPNWKTYCNECYNGKFYEAIQIISDKKDEERDQIKTQTLKAFFGKYWNNGRSKDYDDLKKVFPELLIAITAIKKMYSNYYQAHEVQNLADKRANRLNPKLKTAKSKGSDQLAIILQSFESWLFIDKLLPELLSKGLVVIPRHDSILMKYSDKDEVFRITTLVFNRILGENKYKLRCKDL